MQIIYSTREEIGIIELNNPPYNQLTSPDFINLTELSKFLNRDDIKGVIITGSGKNFCAGADLNILKDQIKDQSRFKKQMDGGKQIINMIYTSPIPVVAAVRGSCLGAGLEIALACHFICASKNAMFGFPETGLNLIPGLGGTVLSRKINRSQMVSLLLSAQMINGEEAQKIGLVDRLYPTKDLITGTFEYLMALISDKPVELIKTIMQSIHNSEILSRDEALKYETKNFIKLARQLIESDPDK
jgi:enoyl-CoA hydratase